MNGMPAAAAPAASTDPSQSPPALFISAFIAIWVAGIVYCDRAALDLFWNAWVGRIVGILFPVIGPLVLGILRRRARRARGF